MKIDLVMWTLNSEKTLHLALNSIKKAIPEKNINNKILVDGGSFDRTIEIARNFGWRVYESEKGIGKQANYALSLVETPYFASFEHDIYLCKNWYTQIWSTLKKGVAVTQGVRLSLNPTLRAFEIYSLKKDNPYSSIDNNVYDTQLIRKIGGFSEKHPYSADRELQDRTRSYGFRWIVNKNIISNHIVVDFFNRVKHIENASKLNDYPEHNKKNKQLERFLFSPIRGIQIAFSVNYPLAFFAYPYWRFYRLKSAITL